MNIVADIERGAYRRRLTLEPGLDEIVAEPRLLERAEWIGDHEFSECKTQGLAEIAMALPGQALGEAVGRKRPQRRGAGTFVLLEDGAGDDDPGKAARKHQLDDCGQIVGVLRDCRVDIELRIAVI